ncbi:MAG: hypothetical protein WA071_00645 [Undibacterium umbellatum]|uniref:hypothetical protein n=1 Tax=Undibacterium umbellatum TaxID=2762300 RepID=UPI003BB53346
MNDLDRIAQRFPSDGERPLADYFVVFLPCHLLLVDALTIERRRLPTPTEFVLKAIQSSISSTHDVAGLLGLSEAYTGKLIENLIDDMFVVHDDLGRLKLTVKGTSVLAADGERRPIDRSVPLLWDPILHSSIRQRPRNLVTQTAAEKLGPIWKMPNIFKQPSLSDLANADSERFSSVQQEDSKSKDPSEVIKFLCIKRCLYRYRPAVVLVYEKENALPIFKVAIDGQIDDVLSTALAQRDGGKFIGIDVGFARKSGALAVKERFKQLKLDGGETESPIEIAELMRKKSSLLFNIAVLQERTAEEPTEGLEKKLVDRLDELKGVEKMLSKARVVPLLQFEIGLILESALESQEELVVTTTMPTADKFTGSLQKRFENFLKAGGTARIYIAGRIEDAAKRDEFAGPLAFLTRLQAANPKLSVFFLKRTQRPVFEIRSGNRVTFSNEPPLGRRAGEFVPRAFRGYHLGHSTSVASYCIEHLEFPREELLTQALDKSRASPRR